MQTFETTARAVKTDFELQQDVMREIRWDSRFERAQIGVAVRNGVVALTGSVDSFGLKWAANEIAHRVSGVLDVANDIQVSLVGTLHKSDAELAAAVRHALEWDVFVPEQKIKTTVSNGWVTLEGEVNLLREREDAGAVIRNLTGVKGVVNLISVRERGLEPAKVRRKIEDVLERRADRDAERISVTVSGGCVTLEGRVRSWSDKNAILGAVGHAPGVRKLDDRLKVDPMA
jgi:osmotically-inducible protein OsmY